MNTFSPQLPGSLTAFNLDLSSFSSIVSVDILWGIVGLLAIILGGVTIVLYYHWLRYGFGDRMVIFAQVLYTLIILVGFVVMIGSIQYYV